jgi:hypothetical protein
MLESKNQQRRETWLDVTAQIALAASGNSMALPVRLALA